MKFLRIKRVGGGPPRTTTTTTTTTSTTTTSTSTTTVTLPPGQTTTSTTSTTTTVTSPPILNQGQFLEFAQGTEAKTTEASLPGNQAGWVMSSGEVQLPHSQARIRFEFTDEVGAPKTMPLGPYVSGGINRGGFAYGRWWVVADAAQPDPVTGEPSVVCKIRVARGGGAQNPQWRNPRRPVFLQNQHGCYWDRSGARLQYGKLEDFTGRDGAFINPRCVNKFQPSGDLANSPFTNVMSGSAANANFVGDLVGWGGVIAQTTGAPSYTASTTTPNLTFPTVADTALRNYPYDRDRFGDMTTGSATISNVTNPTGGSGMYTWANLNAVPIQLINLAPGQSCLVKGAGANGGDLLAKVVAVDAVARTITLDQTALTSVTRTSLWFPGMFNPYEGFQIVGDPDNPYYDTARSNAVTMSGTISSGSTTLSVPTTAGLAAGNPIVVFGAGPIVNGIAQTLVAVITAVGPGSVALSAAATTGVTNASVTVTTCVRTGTINGGSVNLTIATTANLVQNDPIVVAGAASGGTNLQTTISSIIDGTTVQLADAATATASNTNVYIMPLPSPVGRKPIGPYPGGVRLKAGDVLIVKSAKYPNSVYNNGGFPNWAGEIAPYCGAPGPHNPSVPTYTGGGLAGTPIPAATSATFYTEGGGGGTAFPPNQPQNKTRIGSTTIGNGWNNANYFFTVIHVVEKPQPSSRFAPPIYRPSGIAADPRSSPEAINLARKTGNAYNSDTDPFTFDWSQVDLNRLIQYTPVGTGVPWTWDANGHLAYGVNPPRSLSASQVELEFWSEVNREFCRPSQFPGDNDACTINDISGDKSAGVHRIHRMAAAFLDSTGTDEPLSPALKKKIVASIIQDGIEMYSEVLGGTFFIQNSGEFQRAYAAVPVMAGILLNHQGYMAWPTIPPMHKIHAISYTALDNSTQTNQYRSWVPSSPSSTTRTKEYTFADIGSTVGVNDPFLPPTTDRDFYNTGTPPNQYPIAGRPSLFATFAGVTANFGDFTFVHDTSSPGYVDPITGVRDWYYSTYFSLPIFDPTSPTRDLTSLWWPPRSQQHATWGTMAKGSNVVTLKVPPPGAQVQGLPVGFGLTGGGIHRIYPGDQILVVGAGNTGTVYGNALIGYVQLINGVAAPTMNPTTLTLVTAAGGNQPAVALTAVDCAAIQGPGWTVLRQNDSAFIQAYFNVFGDVTNASNVISNMDSTAFFRPSDVVTIVEYPWFLGVSGKPTVIMTGSTTGGVFTPLTVTSVGPNSITLSASATRDFSKALVLLGGWIDGRNSSWQAFDAALGYFTNTLSGLFSQAMIMHLMNAEPLVNIPLFFKAARFCRALDKNGQAIDTEFFAAYNRWTNISNPDLVTGTPLQHLTAITEPIFGWLWEHGGQSWTLP